MTRARASSRLSSYERFGLSRRPTLIREVGDFVAVQRCNHRVMRIQRPEDQSLTAALEDKGTDRAVCEGTLGGAGLLGETSGDRAYILDFTRRANGYA